MSGRPTGSDEAGHATTWREAAREQRAANAPDQSKSELADYKYGAASLKPAGHDPEEKGWRETQKEQRVAAAEAAAATRSARVDAQNAQKGKIINNPLVAAMRKRDQEPKPLTPTPPSTPRSRSNSSQSTGQVRG